MTGGKFHEIPKAAGDCQQNLQVVRYGSKLAQTWKYKCIDSIIEQYRFKHFNIKSESCSFRPTTVTDLWDLNGSEGSPLQTTSDHWFLASSLRHRQMKRFDVNGSLTSQQIRDSTNPTKHITQEQSCLDFSIFSDDVATMSYIFPAIAQMPMSSAAAKAVVSKNASPLSCAGGKIWLQGYPQALNLGKGRDIRCLQSI